MPNFPHGPSDGCFGLRLMSRMKQDVLGNYRWLHREFGDSVSYRLGPFRLFVFFHPEQVREVLVVNAKSTIRDPRVMSVFAQWNGNSLLITEGEAWVKRRRMVQPAFHPRRFENYGRLVVASAERLGDSWARHGTADVEINQAMTDLTLDIICQALFATSVGSHSGEIAKAVRALSEIAFYEMQAPFRWPLWLPTFYNRRKREAMKVIDDVAWRIVRERRAAGSDHGDLLSTLLSSVDEDGKSVLTDEQVRNEAVTLMLAGHDTTAAALDWIWYLLAKHPEIADKCRNEIEAVCGRRNPEAADVPKLIYTEAVIKECLRMYPPAIGTFLRQPKEDIKIGGYDVPRGSLIALASVITHRDARWFPDPNRFDPDRFLPPREQSIPAGAYFPFGMGPRICIGQAFAMTEMTLIVATLLPRFTVSLRSGDPEPTSFVHLALRPKAPLHLVWTPRPSR